MIAARCEAVIAARPTDWGFRPVLCGQAVGLRLHVGADGSVHRACTRDGHLGSVVRRFGRYPGELAADELAAVDRHAEGVLA